MNAQIEKFLGYPVEQLLKTFFWDYATAEYGSLAKTILNLDIDAVWDEEFGIIDSQGAMKWVRVRCQASCDENGRSSGYEGVMVDRTAKKALEEELQAIQRSIGCQIKDY